MTTQSASASSQIPRRAFLKRTSFALGASLLPNSLISAAQQRRAIGANDRIRIGIIGCGQRGRETHMEEVKKQAEAMNLEIVALCDPWRVAREQANAKVREWFGRDAKLFRSHQELLAMDEVDAVMIASPDFHHTTHLEAAARAGKHIYVEKPLATDMQALVRAVDAVKKAKTVVQVGTQLRSLPSIVGARDTYQSGILGEVSMIDESRNDEKPYWYNYIKKDVRQEDVDWKEFLGELPYRPFDPITFSGWYGYYEFCQGPIPQWGAHFIDMMHFITGATIPESCVCHGGIFTWKDEYNFTVPDCVQATWTYPEGFMLSSSNNFGNGSGNRRRMFADKGVMNLDNWNAPVCTAEGGPMRDGSIRGVVTVPEVDSPDHFLNWFQCMRTGATPNASIEAGYQHAVAVLMAVKSYETGKRMRYDSAKRSLYAG